jgi:hypothetical protein
MAIQSERGKETEMTKVLIEKRDWGLQPYVVIIERSGERTYVGGRRNRYAAEKLRLKTLAIVQKMEVR